MTNHEANLEVTESVNYLPVLNFYEQVEVLARSRLSLALKAPADDATLEEREELYRQQHEQILSFVNLLHDSLVSEHGKVLLCLYQCE